MNQEDREMTNAALLLEEKINERVWQAIEKDKWRIDELVFDTVHRNRHELKKYFKPD